MPHGDVSATPVSLSLDLGRLQDLLTILLEKQLATYLIRFS